MKTQDKIVSLKKLKQDIASHKRAGKKIAFTNGCFDLIHLGHVSYLEKAKNEKRILVVGLNTDVSVRRIKGKNRPLNNQGARAKVLAALSCVDYVVLFSESTPLKLIKAIKPDYLIKGADWKGKEVVGSDVLASYGGKVVLIKYLPKYSTSGIIKKIRRK